MRERATRITQPSGLYLVGLLFGVLDLAPKGDLCQSTRQVDSGRSREGKTEYRDAQICVSDNLLLPRTV